MAYRETEMWDVLDVLRRVHQGETKAAIGRVTGRSRATIRRYLVQARKLGWEPGGAEPDEALARGVVARLRPGRQEREPGATEQRLAPHREQIAAWLALGKPERGLRLSKVQQLLARQGVEVPYSSLHRYAAEQLGFADRRRFTVRRAECAPGELAEVDFGRLGLVWDPEAERPRLHHALIVTLAYSRHQYVHVCCSQKLEDLIEGLEEAWAFFGGVPARVVIDNLKAAVTKADRYDPVFQRTFAEYARYRGFVIDAAVPRHATGKPQVERGVQYLRESFFRGEHWIDRDHVQREARRWCLEVAGTRIHGTTRKRPLVVFEQLEQSKLCPLTGLRFDPPVWAQAKVHPDHHVQFHKALYSVPTRHVGKRVWVRGDRHLVRIYVDGELVKTHKPVAEGKRSTDYHDYPEQLAPYAMRDPERILREGRRQGPAIGRFLEALLAGDFPWAKLRQAQKLLRLAQRYGRPRLEAACRRALAFELINVRRVEAIVREGLDSDAHKPTPPASRGQLVLLTPRFLRPAGSFHHATPNQEDPHGDPAIAQDRVQAPQALGPDGDAPRPGGLRPEDEAG
jgi:transposase